MEKGKISEAENLRQNAEEVMYKKSLKTTSIQSEETLELIYQLRETQSELKLQNNKLNLALSNAADAIKLYDLTPAGNFTLSKEGEIIRLTFAVHKCFSKKRSDLINSRLAFLFLTIHDQSLTSLSGKYLTARQRIMRGDPVN